VQFGQFFELVDFLSLVIDEHLKEEGLSLFADKVVHRFVNFDSVFDGIFGCLEEASFGLIVGLVLIFFAQLIELADGDTLFLDTLLPHFQILISLFLFSFSFFLFFLHPEDLPQLFLTSASSGMAKGLSYLGTFPTVGNLVVPFLLYSSNYLFLISYIISAHIHDQMYCLVTR